MMLRTTMKCEYLVAVKWIKDVSHDDARFVRNAGLFAHLSVVASLSRQLKTLACLQKNLRSILTKLLSVE